MYYASYAGHEDIIEDLIVAGANINVKNKFGYTPLLSASGGNGRAKSIKLLVNKGADVNVKGNDGKTPMYITAGYGLD